MQDEDLTSAIRALVSDTQSSITGLLSVTIIDHLGVPFFQESVNRDDHNLRIERFTSIGGQDQQQAVKRLNQGENKFTIAFYKNHQSIQINKYPLTIVFSATESANTGLILKKAEELDPYFEKARRNTRTLLHDAEHNA